MPGGGASAGPLTQPCGSAEYAVELVIDQPECVCRAGHADQDRAGEAWIMKSSTAASRSVSTPLAISPAPTAARRLCLDT